MYSIVLTLGFLSGDGGGFNPIDLAAGGNLFWTAAIFLISVPFIWAVVMGPVTRALEERDQKTERAIAAAEKASKDAEAARATLEVTLGEARAEAAKLLAEARTRAEARAHEIEDGAKGEAAKLLDGARKAIKAEQDKAVSAIRNEVVELSLRAASQVLERNVGSDDDRRFARQVVAAGEKVK